MASREIESIFEPVTTTNTLRKIKYVTAISISSTSKYSRIN